LAWLAGWQTRAPRPHAKLSCMRVEGWQAGGVAGRPAKRRAAEREREREREREKDAPGKEPPPCRLDVSFPRDEPGSKKKESGERRERGREGGGVGGVGRGGSPAKHLLSTSSEEGTRNPT
jgi:hypothetical protein